jgi:alpha-tubulin suppressor-like RCC1 family protein
LFVRELSRMLREMRRARALALLSLVTLVLGSIALAGCPASNDEASGPPGCKTGFRSQCIGDAAIGSGFGCALLGDQTVWCWGRNDEGQLGYATTDLCPEDIGGGQTRSIACHTFPFQVVGLTGATAIAAGDAFSCAVTTDGNVKCWGANAVGQLGNGSTTTSQTPVVATSIAKATSVTLGSQHACALADGKVWCWGANDLGQLGVKTTGTCAVDATTNVACSKTPVEVTELGDVVELSAGAGHTCARSSDGFVTCWGDNRWGQLGYGKSDVVAAGTKRRVLVTLDAPLDGALQISAGAMHTCALRDGGSVFCWGRDDHDELGAAPPGSGAVGCADACSTLAVAVPGLPSTSPLSDAGADAGTDASSDADAIADAPSDASTDSIIDTKIDAAKDTSSSIDTTPSPDTAPPRGAFDRSITSGSGYSCVRLDDSTVRCWGQDSVGQLGDGRTTSDPSEQVLVIASPGAASNNPLQGVTVVRAGASSACAIMSDMSLRCWGSNQGGALGVGHFTPQQGPVPVSW